MVVLLVAIQNLVALLVPTEPAAIVQLNHAQQPLLRNVHASGGMSDIFPSIALAEAEDAPVTLALPGIPDLSSLKNQANDLQKQLTAGASSIQERLRAAVNNANLKDLEAGLKDATPLIEQNLKAAEPVLKARLQETEKAILDAEPVLKKKADDLAPVLQSAGESALVKLGDVVKRGVETADGTLGATGYKDETLAIAAVVVGLPVAYRVFSFLRAIALPALGLLVVLAGLGVSSELSTNIPALGNPVEVFLNLAGFTALSGAALFTFLKVTEAVDALTNSFNQGLNNVAGKLSGANKKETKQAGKRGGNKKATKQASKRAGRGGATKTEEAPAFLNPFRTPDEYSAVPPPRGKQKKSK